MPTCRRKRVLLTQPDDDLLLAANNDPDREVYYLAQTGEIFDSYEAYAARMSFYKLKQFQCEVTGRSGLDYFQALESELEEARTLHSRFPEQLKAAVLRSVQWQVMGRLDHLVEAVYERYKDRYFEGEKVYIDVQGDRFSARIAQVFPPKSLVASFNSSTNGHANGATPSSSKPVSSASTNTLKRKRGDSSAVLPNGGEDYCSPNEKPSSSSAILHNGTQLINGVPIHEIGGDLRISLAEGIERDDPTKYFYKVQISGDGSISSHGHGHASVAMNGVKEESLEGSISAATNGRRESARAKEKMLLKQETASADATPDVLMEVDAEEKKTKWSGSLMEVQYNVMSRDRIAFSKSLLRRFLRDSLDRSASLASPWIVKQSIAEKYGVPTEMPPEIKAGVQQVRDEEIGKRKRVWEEKEAQAEREGKYTKKMKKRDEDAAKAATKAADAERKAAEVERKATAQAQKADRLANERAAKAEAQAQKEREKAEKEKKKPVRYPMEDLDVKYYERERKNGVVKGKKPIPARGPDRVPFVEVDEREEEGWSVGEWWKPTRRSTSAVEGFLMTWNFLNCFGHPLHLSCFTLDEYEHALRHNVLDLPCPILAEIHSVLIYNIRTVPSPPIETLVSTAADNGNGNGNGNNGRVSVATNALRNHYKDEVNASGKVKTNGNGNGVGAEGVRPTVEELCFAVDDVGNNWMRVPLRVGEGRMGWEEALVGCLKDHATVRTFPRLRIILERLCTNYGDESGLPSTGPLLSRKPKRGRDSSPSSDRSSPLSSPPPSSRHPHKSGSSSFSDGSGLRAALPSERYHLLPPGDRIAILQFLCELATSSKSVHLYMESCEEQLTALRKEKIEVNRQKKQLTEEMAVIMEGQEALQQEQQQQQQPPPEMELITPPIATLNGASESSDVESEATPFEEGASESGSAAGRKSVVSSSSGRQITLRLKVQQGKAAQAQGKAQAQAQSLSSSGGPSAAATSKQREQARARSASAKRAVAEHRRLDEELNKVERKLESIERDFRKLLGVVRVKPLGKDRFFNRIWWFDGNGGSSLLGSGGVVQYGTGRIFIQGPSEFDVEILQRREESMGERRKEEEGEEGVLETGEWGVYSTVEEVTEYLAWLNPKGHREFALKTMFSKWWDHIGPGMRKRQADLNMTAKLPEARRSTRGKNPVSDVSREPYMLWTNRKAVKLD